MLHRDKSAQGKIGRPIVLTKNDERRRDVMPMLDHADWMAATKRGPLMPRSTELKAIDKAIEAYKLGKTPANLTKIKTALDAWIKKKGNNWKNSERNSDGAVEALQTELNQKMATPGSIAKAAVGVVLKPKAPVPKYATMTDDVLVTRYTTHAKDCFKNHWDKTKAVQTGTKMLDGILDVHGTCGIPAVAVSIKSLPPGYNGFFDFTTWTIEISDKKFSDYDMVYTDPVTKQNPHPYFINIAETLYHEARHCEQWWHMTRFAIHGSDATKVSQQLGVPLAIANAAARKPMKNGDPMLDKTEEWFESVYGGGRREIVLKGLALKRNAHPSPKIKPSDQGGGEIYGQYQGNLAEEVDAWGIQTLVRAKF
jgi:hypothetical protein